MSGYAPPTRDRLPAAIVAVAIQAALLWALIVGLTTTFRTTNDEAMSVFSVEPSPRTEPKTVEKRSSPSRRPEGAASPPNLRSRATELVAPPPALPLPPVVIAAPVPLTGTDASTGSADIAGPGTGAGGTGNGLGSGAGGDGDGGGGDETPPEWRSGRLRDSDFPDALRETTRGGAVGVRYTVMTSGRVGNCRITRTSGVPLLDQMTCRLIVERFRFRPSRDAARRPVAADIVETHEWVNEMTAVDLEEPPPVRRRRGR
ncbi:energy transducer TonB [Sphingomonas sp.]|uniref:energy transducer TonB n=1 Tax=Sphingomonas sp. TaxID=28214 RepID=UPI002DD63A06|nr:energy transducer TonB [Sphingomonas sp.]